MSAGEGTEKVPEIIGELLTQYNEVFGEPKGLPPSKRQDHIIPLHKISLKKGSVLTFQRLHRIPYTHKAEIERQVKEILSASVIQHSNSPFASPVLLVLKKDETWRLYIGYRRLNNMTVKNKFPIPVIKELLNELE